MDNTLMPDSTNPAKEPALTSNNRTLESYEACALQYAASVSKEPGLQMKDLMLRMVEIAGQGGSILEVGSGPGWDADFVESLGVTVRRTDATAAFRDFQTQRGKIIEPLNILNDDSGGPYAGVMALYVLQHIPREQVQGVLCKTAVALRPGGCFLVCILEGKGEKWERSATSGEYHVVFWQETDFVDALMAEGLQVMVTKRHDDNEGSWLTFLAQKQ